MNPFLAIFILLMLSAFFAASETAIFSLSKMQRKRLEKSFPRRGGMVTKLLETPRRTLVAILVGNNVVNILGGAIIAYLFFQLWDDIGLVLAIPVYTIFQVIFGEILPKAFAVRAASKLSLWIAYPLNYFAIAIAPARITVRKITEIIVKFLEKGFGTQNDEALDNQLQALIRLGHKEGTLDRSEAKRLKSLFSLGERWAREIMTPRTNMITYDLDDDRETLVELIQKYHHSYFPVYQGSLDHVLGVVSTRQVMLWPEKAISELLMKPYYVPETKEIDALLMEMKKAQIYCAICVDEYGGTAGLVTPEDILEEIFGEIYDEYALAERKVVKVKKGEYLLDGQTLLQDVNELMEIELESEMSETLAGFLMEKTGRVLKPRDIIIVGALRFQVRAMDKNRVLKVLLRAL